MLVRFLLHLVGRSCPVGIALDIMLLGHTVGAGSIPVAHTLFSYKRKMQPKSNKKYSEYTGIHVLVKSVGPMS